MQNRALSNFFAIFCQNQTNDSKKDVYSFPIQLKNALVFSHSVSVEGFGQLMNNFFLMHKVIIPFSGDAQGGPGGGFKDEAKNEERKLLKILV